MTLPLHISRAIEGADHDEARRFAEYAAAQALTNGKMAEDLIELIGHAVSLLLCGRTADALDLLETVNNAAAEAKERRHG